VARSPDGAPAAAFTELWREAQLRLSWDDARVQRV
jgi:hypothetical protein